ncbi:MAG TPA: hypothetical protein VFN81_08705 [Sphingomicrobium sp.]|nr:hypothetical protein [Sphingomicrobium sp.]
MKKKKAVEKISGFKGFDADLKCNGHQYKIGEATEHAGAVELCKSGFHFCEHPLDVFKYYPPATSRFAEVEAEGVSDKKDGDTKRVCKRLVVKAELSLHAMIQAAVKFTFDRVDWTRGPSAKGNGEGAQNAEKTGAASATGDQGAASATGNRGAASATGNRGAASATGYQGAASATGDLGAASATGYQGAASATGNRGAASATGDQGAASATGKEGCAVALGLEGRAKGVKGTWLTIAEWKEIDDEWHRFDVQTVRVDGEKIKEDTFYWLRDGKFEEAK